MNQHITYIFPSRSRHIKFLNAIENINKLSMSDNYEIIGVADNDDDTMQEFRDEDFVSEFTNLKVYFGDSKSKVHACNRELDKINPDTDIVILMSDDFKILMPGFDNVIREAFADGFKGLLHLPDGREKYIPQKTICCQFTEYTHNGWKQMPTGKWDHAPSVGEKTTGDVFDIFIRNLKMQLVTFPIMHIDFVRRFNYIYHPDYKSVRCDEEQTQVAKDLGLYKFIDRPIVEHQHYRHGFGEPDELYKHNDSGEMYAHDKIVFQERAAKNFDLP